MASTIAYCKKRQTHSSIKVQNLPRLLLLRTHSIFNFYLSFIVSCMLCFSLNLNQLVYADNDSPSFSIQSLETLMHNRVYLLNANFSYQFSQEAIEALEHGVPLLILVDIEILTPRWYWADKTIAELEQGYLLIYHALSESYVVNNLNSGTQTNFLHLKQALNSLSQIQELPILDANLLKEDKDYYLRVRTHLDIESLPAPMRPLAYISSDWSLSSDWYEWPLQK